MTTASDEDGRAHVFPPVFAGRYDVVDGRVRTRALEAHVIDHCNLKCAECCSLSPLLPPWFARPEDVAADLASAGRVLAPAIFKIVGGEPTLHPELVEIARIAAASKVARSVSVTTNGFLLDRMPDALWEQVDAFTISLYPSPALSSSTIGLIKQQAERFAVTLNWKQQDQFVRMNRPAGDSDVAETQRIYDSCWLRDRCHIVRAGRFFTCTRPPHCHSWVQSRGGADDFLGDGLLLTDSTVGDVLSYLQRAQPLKACQACNGGGAPIKPHRQMSRDEVRLQTTPLHGLKILA